jgi:hypothetical protein
MNIELKMALRRVLDKYLKTTKGTLVAKAHLAQ